MAKKKKDLTGGALEKRAGGKSEPSPLFSGFTELAKINLDELPVRPSGIGLRSGEFAAIELLAKQYGMTRNNLMRLGVRRLIEQIKAGEFDPSKEEYLQEKPQVRRRLDIAKAAKG